MEPVRESWASFSDDAALVAEFVDSCSVVIYHMAPFVKCMYVTIVAIVIIFGIWIKSMPGESSAYPSPECTDQLDPIQHFYFRSGVCACS